MKKIIICFLLLFATFFSGCKHINEIENNRVVTACIITKTDDELVYGFYVSVPTGGEGGEDTGSKSSAKVYDFKAENFAKALEEFEKSGAYRADFAHISLFMANDKYFNENFKEDEKYIRDHISATPLMYTNVYKGDRKDFIECIEKEYNSKPDEFVKNIFSSKSSYLSCVMSELSLSVYNKYYTSVLPVIEVNKKGENVLPVISAVTLFSDNKKLVWLTDDDFKAYSSWRKYYNNASDGYKINIKNNTVNIVLNDTRILETAKKHSANNADVLNVMYFMKKSFLTYNDYVKFAENYELKNAEFTGDIL